MSQLHHLHDIAFIRILPSLSHCIPLMEISRLASSPPSLSSYLQLETQIEIFCEAVPDTAQAGLFNLSLA